MLINNVNGSLSSTRDINTFEWFSAKTRDYHSYSISNDHIGVDNFVDQKFKLDISNDIMDLPLMYVYKFYPYNLVFNNLIRLNREMGNSCIYLSMTDNCYRSLNPTTLYTAPVKSFMKNIFKNMKPDNSNSRYCLKDGVLFKNDFPVIISCISYDMAVDHDKRFIDSFVVYIDKGLYTSKEKFDKVLVNLIGKHYLTQKNVNLSLKVCDFSRIVLSLGKYVGYISNLPKIKPTRKNIKNLLLAYPF